MKPVFGLPLTLPAAAEQGKGAVALVFVRPLSSPLGRLALLELQAAWPALDRAGVVVVAFSRAELKEAQDFIPRNQLIFPLMLDPDGETARAFGLAPDQGFRATLGALSPALLKRGFGALSLGRGHLGLPQSDRVATLLIGPGGRVVWSHYASSILEGPDVGGLLEAVGSLS